MALNFLNITQDKTQPILSKINDSSVCRTSCSLEFKDERAWLNPSDQQSFNSGWFTEQDFEDWINGTGNIVKGHDIEEKAIVWEYATFKANISHSHLITLNHRFFHLVGEDYKRINDNFKPYKIDNNNHNEIISNIFGNFVPNTSRQFEYMKFDSIYSEFRENLWGVKATLRLLGIGYLDGGCNIEGDVNNFSWFSDVAFGKAYYLHLKRQGTKFPDFDFIENNRYKI